MRATHHLAVDDSTKNFHCGSGPLAELSTAPLQRGRSVQETKTPFCFFVCEYINQINLYLVEMMQINPCYIMMSTGGFNKSSRKPRFLNLSLFVNYPSLELYSLTTPWWSTQQWILRTSIEPKLISFFHLCWLCCYQWNLGVMCSIDRRWLDWHQNGYATLTCITFFLAWIRHRLYGK